MTQQEILNYNKRCAEFLGFKYKNQAKFWAKYPLNNNSFLALKGWLSMDRLQFHSDWNWIMEVVETIETKFTKYILQWEYDDREEFAEDGKYKAYWFTLFPKNEICSGLSDLRSKSRKEAVVQAINQFLIWYNENK